MTEEQKNLEQEKLFREAREQYDQEQMALNTVQVQDQSQPCVVEPASNGNQT